jgi:hypothetical protein
MPLTNSILLIQTHLDYQHHIIYAALTVHQGISRRVLRGTTYDPGHWTFYFVDRDLA